jgi:hypothetical protein
MAGWSAKHAKDAARILEEAPAQVAAARAAAVTAAAAASSSGGARGGGVSAVLGRLEADVAALPEDPAAFEAARAWVDALLRQAKAARVCNAHTGATGSGK